MFVLEKALEIASHITHPVAALLFALVLATYLTYPIRRTRKPLAVYLLAAGIIVAGLFPLSARTYLHSRAIYRVRIIAIGPDRLPVEEARVTSSVGGEPKKVEGGWEIDIPPQTRPADGKVILYASVKNAFLSGSYTLVLGQDYYPTSTIQLTSDTSAILRGVVLDEHSGPIADATVSIDGYPDMVITDKVGNFALPAHAAEGQIVKVRAQKGKLIGSMSVPAGHSVELVIK